MRAVDAQTAPPQPEMTAFAPPTGELPTGRMVGQYRIERRIGRGGMGVVYAASQPEIGAQVALKVLDAQRAADARLVRRFLDEARAVNRIRHPNIIDVFAFGRLEDGRHYFVMEFLEGETLAARLDRGPLGPSEGVPLLLQICQALEAAHREGIVHRDIKPENVWIARPKHGASYVKILDFGIAKLLQRDSSSMATEEGTVIGTPHFMSPEQCRGEPVDHRTDIYALGVVLYQVFTTHLPFEGASPAAVISQQITALPVAPSAHRPIPAALEQLILRCLAKDPTDRPQGAGAVGAALGRILFDDAALDTLPSAAAVRRRRSTLAEGESVAARPGDEPPRHDRRGNALVVAMALLALVVAIGGFWIYRAATGVAGTRATVARPPARANACFGAVAGTAEDGASRPNSAICREPTASDRRLSDLTPVALQPAAGDAPAPRPRRVLAPSRGRPRQSRATERSAQFLTENPFR